MKDEIKKMRNCLWFSKLIRQNGFGQKAVRQLFTRWADLDDLVNAEPVRLSEVMQGSPEKISRLLVQINDRHWWSRLDDEAKTAADKGIRAIFYQDDDFPSRLKEISGCPPVLYYRGQRYQEIINQEYFVTVIGTRTPTAYGKMVTERITRELASESVVIISGLARGIDAAAHRAALKTRGLTIAVIGCGPDLTYPPEHAELMETIAEAGLIISEHPPGTPPLRQHFPARNRILSGLADAVAVIEASSDSGTMITAGFAGDQGRDVFAVPGSIFSPYSQGCNRLIRDGAGILESASDILWRLPSGSIQTRLEQAIRQQMPKEINFTADGKNENVNGRQKLHQVLLGHPLTLAEIAGQMDLTIAETAVLLTAHELEGDIECERGRYSLTEKAIFCI